MRDADFGMILEKYKDSKRDKLIPILQEVQDAVGFVSRESVAAIGKLLNLPASKIYGVATFYNQFRFKPNGQFHIMICRGTACHVKGSAEILEVIEEELSIKSGETTRDGLFSLDVVACIGACGLAPLISVNDEIYGNLSKESTVGILNSYRKKGDKNG